MNPGSTSLPTPHDAAAMRSRLELADDPSTLAESTRWFATPSGQREGVSQLLLSGLHCAACAGIIETALMDVNGVVSARVSPGSSRAEVRWDPARTRLSAVLRAVLDAGYGAVPDAAAPAREQRRTEQRRALWRLFVAGFCMMQVMMYAAPAYFAEPGTMAPDVQRLLQWASWLLTLPVLVFAAGPFFSGAWRSLKARRIGMDVPVALGLLVTFIASSGATFDPGGVFGHEVYFDSLTMFVFFLLGGRSLELRARHRVAATLEDSMARLPEGARRVDDAGREEFVPLSRLAEGDRVRVLAGEAFAADGVLLHGRTLADEALLTGESSPVVKDVGDEVVAGSINLHAPVLLRVLRLGADTRFEAIRALMRSALTQRPELVRQADRWAGPFLWGVLLLSAAGAAAWTVIDPSRAVWVAVSVLIVTCPCALSLAAPSALLAATGALARRGVLLQRIEALEALSRVDWVCLDKTGTLTQDRLEIVAVQAAAGEGADVGALQSAAAVLAALSTHPASRAIAATLPATQIAGHGWTEVQELPGMGLQARAADGTPWRLGRADWVAPAASGTATPAGDAVAFGPVGRVALTFELAEMLRPDAAAAVARLRASGLRLTMLSGDAPQRAAAIAARLGIDDVRAAATPETKLALLAQLQSEGHVVAMVGDGLNDAPVLAQANVSFAFAHGAAVSKSAADAIVLSERLSDVADARGHASRTMQVVRQNLAWAAIYNAACIPLALAGLLPPWAAGIGMAGSSLFVVLNATRLGRMPAAA
jgi:P-type Cu2+ transporter